MKKIKADRRVVGTRPWFVVQKMYRDQRREQAAKHDRKPPKFMEHETVTGTMKSEGPNFQVLPKSSLVVSVLNYVKDSVMTLWRHDG